MLEVICGFWAYDSFLYARKRSKPVTVSKMLGWRYAYERQWNERIWESDKQLNNADFCILGQK